MCDLCYVQNLNNAFKNVFMFKMDEIFLKTIKIFLSRQNFKISYSILKYFIKSLCIYILGGTIKLSS